MTEYIAINSVEDIIEHYGIKGMRWGVRSRNKGLSSSYSQYKQAKKENRKARSGARFGQNDILYDKAVRSLSKKKMAKYKYKADRDAALLKEKPGSKKLQDRIKNNRKKASEYKEVFDKYDKHIKNDKNHPTLAYYDEHGNNLGYGEYYNHVKKNNLSGKEKAINKSLNRRGKIRRAADIAASTAVVGGLMVAPALLRD